MSEGGGVDKALLAFINGLSKRVYFKQDDISDEFLRDEILGGLDNEGTVLINFY